MVLLALNISGWATFKVCSVIIYSVVIRNPENGLYSVLPGMVKKLTGTTYLWWKSPELELNSFVRWKASWLQDYFVSNFTSFHVHLECRILMTKFSKFLFACLSCVWLMLPLVSVRSWGWVSLTADLYFFQNERDKYLNLYCYVLPTILRLKNGCFL